MNDLISATGHRPALVIVEGQFDIEFLRRVSHILNADDPSAPDIHTMEQSGNVVFIPFGGGGQAEWITRFQPLRLREFHLFDRETPPETDARIAAAESINARPGCHAVVMRRRSLENYLHPVAVAEAFDVQIEITPGCSVVERLATDLHRSGQFAVHWQHLPHKRQRRFFNRLKRRLNTVAVECMTADLLAQSDPDAEIRSWFKAITELAAS